MCAGWRQDIGTGVMLSGHWLRHIPLTGRCFFSGVAYTVLIVFFINTAHITDSRVSLIYLSFFLSTYSFCIHMYILAVFAKMIMSLLK